VEKFLLHKWRVIGNGFEFSIFIGGKLLMLWQEKRKCKGHISYDFTTFCTNFYGSKRLRFACANNRIKGRGGGSSIDPAAEYSPLGIYNPGTPFGKLSCQNQPASTIVRMLCNSMSTIIVQNRAIYSYW